MKEEWKVYIKGVPNRGNEIVKALTDLGGKEPFYTGSYTNENFIYFINHKGEIDYEYLDTEQGQIIMDNYREIKLSEQWKDGDIIFSPKFESFAVYGYDGSDNPIALYCHVTKTDIISYPTRAMRCDYRLATSEEINQFHELLHKHNKDWDSEKKQLVDWKWKPKFNEKYWIITTTLDVNFFIWKESPTDIQMLDSGNCFKTKEDAKITAKKIKDLLKMK